MLKGYITKYLLIFKRNTKMLNDEMSIQYLGQSGYSSSCLVAIAAILNSGHLPSKATIVSLMHEPQKRRGDHLFLFWNWWYFPVTIVPSGFASGYAGEGPKSFSLAICMVASKGIPMEEINVNKAEFEAIDQGRFSVSEALYLKVKAGGESLTFEQLSDIYVTPEHRELFATRKLWKAYHWRGPGPDSITEAIASVDDYDSEVGKRLRQAVDKVASTDAAEWKDAGTRLSDAWVEFVNRMCRDAGIVTSGIDRDNVRELLKRLELDKATLNLATSALDLSQGILRNRSVSRSTSDACLTATAMSMQMLLNQAKWKQREPVESTGLRTLGKEAHQPSGTGMTSEFETTHPTDLTKSQYYSVFVCYGEPEKDFTLKLVKDLEARGVTCWAYARDLTPGERTWKEINEKRREAGKMIVLCSVASLSRDGALKEIEEQIDENPDKIVPISLDRKWKEEDFKVVRGRDLKPFLLDRNYVDFIEKSLYEDSLKRLLKGLRRET